MPSLSRKLQSSKNRFWQAVAGCVCVATLPLSEAVSISGASWYKASKSLPPLPLATKCEEIRNETHVKTQPAQRRCFFAARAKLPPNDRSWQSNVTHAQATALKAGKHRHPEMSGRRRRRCKKPATHLDRLEGLEQQAMQPFFTPCAHLGRPSSHKGTEVLVKLQSCFSVLGWTKKQTMIGNHIASHLFPFPSNLLI